MSASKTVAEQRGEWIADRVDFDEDPNTHSVVEDFDIVEVVPPEHPRPLPPPKNKGGRPATSQQKLREYGLEAVHEDMLAGRSYREIATKLGVGLWPLYQFLNSSKDVSEQTARVSAASAEAWLDRGLDVLYTAAVNPTFCSNAAKAIAQECARRAGTRNPRYVDKVQHTVGVDPAVAAIAGGETADNKPRPGSLLRIELIGVSPAARMSELAIETEAREVG